MYCPHVGDPVGAAGGGVGVRAARRHVFVKRGSPVGEYRMDVRGDRDDPLRKFPHQPGEKRRRVFGRRNSDLGIEMLRDLFDREEDGRNLAKVAVVGEDDFVVRDLKRVRPLLIALRERRTGLSPANPAVTAALQTSIERGAAELGKQARHSLMAVVEREASAPAIGENDRLLVVAEHA